MTDLKAIACALVWCAGNAVAVQPHPELSRVYLGGDKLMPSVVSRVLPEYPAGVSNLLSGDVDVETVVGTTGTVLHARAALLRPGWDAFQAAALDAARKWQFRPAVMDDGTPLPVLVLVRMSFRGARADAAPETSGRVMPVPRTLPRVQMPALAFSSVPSGPAVIRSVKPQYTAQAMQRSVQGTVTLSIVIMPDGTVGQATVIKSLDRQYGLDDQAIVAARYWLFEPAIVDGVAVAVRKTLELEFRMQSE